MADDSEKIKEVFAFHPCDTPRGMLYYKLKELTDHQRRSLNHHKLEIMREHQKFLNDHPEVRTVISILLKVILMARPKVNVQEFLANYLTISWPELKKEVERCVALKAAEKKKETAFISLDQLEGSIMGEEVEIIDDNLLYITAKNSYESIDNQSIPETQLIEIDCKKILNKIIDDIDDDSNSIILDLAYDDDYDDSDPMLNFPSQVVMSASSEKDFSRRFSAMIDRRHSVLEGRRSSEE